MRSGYNGSRAGTSPPATSGVGRCRTRPLAGPPWLGRVGIEERNGLGCFVHDGLLRPASIIAWAARQDLEDVDVDGGVVYEGDQTLQVDDGVCMRGEAATRGLSLWLGAGSH
jgi:hypothetical protein